MKYSHIERREIELTCIAPIHIGSGDMLKTIDYVYDEMGKMAYFLDESKWKRFLIQKGLLDNFIDYVGRGRPNIKDWLRTVRLSVEDIRPLVARVCRVVPKDAFVQKGRSNINDVHCLVTTAKGLPYIPGSSIKGALRSGLLYAWLQAHPKAKERYWKCIGEKGCITSLEREAFSCLALDEEKKANDAVKSCLRGLSVSDTEPLSVDRTVLLQKRDATTKLNKRGQAIHDLPLYRECIPAGSKLRFSITLDTSMTEEIGIHSIAEIIQASRQFTAHNVAMLQRVFGKEYKNACEEAKLADMMLGGGAGFQSKTVFYALAPNGNNDKVGRRVLAAQLDKSFKKHRHPALDTQIAPRTLKLVRDGNEQWIMGLCSLREV